MRTLAVLLLLSAAAYADEWPTAPLDREWTCSMVLQVHIDKGRGYTPGTYRDVALLGGNGNGARADLTVGPDGSVDDVKVSAQGRTYVMGDRLSADLPGGEGFALTIEGLTDFHPAMLVRGIKSRARAQMMGRNPCVSEPTFPPH